MFRKRIFAKRPVWRPKKKAKKVIERKIQKPLANVQPGVPILSRNRLTAKKIHVCTMKFYEKLAITPGAVSEYSADFETNDLKDPLAGLGAIKYNGFDQMIALWRNYLVTDYHVRWTYLNRTADSVQVFSNTYCSGQNAPSLPFGHSTTATFKLAADYNVGAAGLPTIINRKNNIAKFTQERSKLTDENPYAGIDGGNPVENVYERFSVVSDTGTSLSDFYLHVECWAKVVWFGTKRLDDIV